MKRSPAVAKNIATQLMIALDRLDEIEKADLLARIFRAFVERRIDNEEMRRLCAALDRVFLSDLVALRQYLRQKKALSREHLGGLESSGMVIAYHSIVRPVRSGEVQGKLHELNFLVTRNAVLLVDIVFPIAVRTLTEKAPA